MATPMFPLAAGLLPGAVLQLRVFEPRYLAMISEVLADDHQMGVVMIERGPEVGGDDVRSDVGAMARLADVRPAGPNLLWVLAVGVRRIRVQRWLPDDPYPQAEIEAWPDEPDAAGGEPDPPPLLADLPSLVTTARGLAARLAGHPEPEIPDEPVALGDDPSLAAYHAAAMAPLGPLDRFEVLRTPGAGERVAVAHRLITEAAELLKARIDLGAR